MQDKTFEFEKRRNVPIKYSRDLVQTTLQAMKRIAEIKARRERAFWKNRYATQTLSLISRITNDVHRFLRNRMSNNKSRKLTHQTSEISRHINLVQPRASTKAMDTEEIMPLDERAKMREKIRVNANKRTGIVPTKAMKKSALVPADGGMGMGMDVEL
jgi:large subunit ribosomal protein L24e